MNQPLFDPHLFLALREAARGDIHLNALTGELRRRDTAAPARVADALTDLRRGGYLHARATEQHPWHRLELTTSGTRLLAAWLAATSAA